MSFYMHAWGGVGTKLLCKLPRGGSFTTCRNMSFHMFSYLNIQLDMVAYVFLCRDAEGSRQDKRAAMSGACIVLILGRFFIGKHFKTKWILVTVVNVISVFILWKLATVMNITLKLIKFVHVRHITVIHIVIIGSIWLILIDRHSNMVRRSNTWKIRVGNILKTGTCH